MGTLIAPRAVSSFQGGCEASATDEGLGARYLPLGLQGDPLCPQTKGAYSGWRLGPTLDAAPPKPPLACQLLGPAHPSPCVV